MLCKINGKEVFKIQQQQQQQQHSEEIGEIIESAPSTPLRVIEEPKYPKQQEVTTTAVKVGTSSSEDSTYASRCLPTRNTRVPKRQNSLPRGNNKTIIGDDIGEWSNSILAEFNSIIANEINELTKEKSINYSERRNTTRKEKEEPRTIKYKELLSEFGLSDSENSEGSYCEINRDNVKNNKYWCNRGETYVDEVDVRSLLNSDYESVPNEKEISRRKSGSLPDNLGVVIDQHRYRLVNDDRQSNEFLSRNVKNHSASWNNRNVSSLPTRINRAVEDVSSEPKKIVGIITVEESKSKLPPRQRTDSQRKHSLPVIPTNQKRRRDCQPRFQRFKRTQDDQDVGMDPDYDDVFKKNDDHVIAGRSKSLDNNVPKSAPVTPTEEKKPPFGKFLKRRQTPVFHENSNDVVLVRVSSLPDQDLLHLGNRTKDGTSSKKRAVSPFTLRSDISAKRLSESDRDVRETSPVDLKKFSISRSRGNDVAVECDLPEDRNDSVCENVRIENGEVKRIVEEQNARSGSLPISLHSLLSRIRSGSGSCCPNSPPMESFTCSDIATQTSPPISRSSSFTWVSECESPRVVVASIRRLPAWFALAFIAESQLDSQSLQDESTLDPPSPQDTVDDDNRSSSSSQDLLQSMDEISSGSLSPDATDRASPLESGIGTASPPRSTDRRLTKPPTSNKCHRKETWERIRRRPSKLSSRNDKNNQDVWIKRESVHTQTKDHEDRYLQEAVDSSSGLDDSLPRVKPPRPTNLPLCLSTTVSSLSSGELLETPPRAPSSPSAASLQLKPEPLTVEMGGKSSSAPLLENNDVEKNAGKNSSLQQPRSQSERQLSVGYFGRGRRWALFIKTPRKLMRAGDIQGLFIIDIFASTRVGILNGNSNATEIQEAAN
ncbi:hypothetical protein HZH66_006068 [Vespula vulgaris]|uniref:Uncharacterized protein n=1 Tax=Vespula vulgaris TaxID=7454 RepID=A0A834K5K7_VESVU|nr:hypothetical protein HZH66_006068 [Vespula vulgaris]